MSNENNNNILGVLTGIAIGAGLGILFAPDKGSKTRTKIAEGAIAAKDTVETEAAHLKDTVVEKAETLKDSVADTLHSKASTLEEKLDVIVSDVSYKADDLISNLEEKLKILKDRNKKLQTK
ncbi:YtxH domain-containing protein [Tenacibaculum piscium]|uniref:YtxH domain-containing protein n=1 Tax=Tenacibaculum piscium TaxID=1458515 RepID=UPI001F35F6D2|nr:YtxH domain-containing protein [Tenacibaculum piscium]